MAISGVNLTFDNGNFICEQRYEGLDFEGFQVECYAAVNVDGTPTPANSKDQDLILSWSSPSVQGETIADIICRVAANDLSQTCDVVTSAARVTVSVNLVLTDTNRNRTRSQNSTKMLIPQLAPDQPPPLDPASLPQPDQLSLWFDAANPREDGTPPTGDEVLWQSLTDARTASLQNFISAEPDSGFSGSGTVSDPYHIKLDSNDDYLNAGTTQAPTYAVWVRFQSTGTGYIIERGDTNIRLSGGAAIMNYDHWDTNNYARSTGVAAGQWYHLAMTNDGFSTYPMPASMGLGNSSWIGSTPMTKPPPCENCIPGPCNQVCFTTNIGSAAAIIRMAPTGGFKIAVSSKKTTAN